MAVLGFGDGPKTVHRRRRRVSGDNVSGGIRRFREKYKVLKKEEVGKEDGINHWEDVQAVVALSCHVAHIIKEVEDRMHSTKGATSLDLSNTYLGDAGAKIIAEAIEEDNTLTSLRFGLNGFKSGRSGGLKVLADAIAKNHNIKHLDFSHSRSIGLQGFWALAAALANHPSLVSLNLSYNTMGSEGAKAFGWVTFNANNDNKDSVSTNLTSIDMTGNCIGDSAVAVLADVLMGEAPIKILKLGYNEIGHVGGTALGKALRLNSRVQELDLQMNTLQEKGARQLMSLLTQNRSVQRLNLAFCAIGSTDGWLGGKHTNASGGGQAPAFANQVLTDLNLSNNCLIDTDSRGLTQLVLEFKALTSLDLASNYLTHRAGVHVADALKRLPLQSMNLFGNFLGDNGAWALCPAIQHHRHLLSINLGRNGVGDMGAWAIAESVKKNTNRWEHRWSIGLRENPIRTEGAVMIAAALKGKGVPQTIRCLSLQDCQMTDESAKALLGINADDAKPQFPSVDFFYKEAGPFRRSKAV